MRKRVTVVCLSICVCVTILTVPLLIFAVQALYERNLKGTSKVLTHGFCYHRLVQSYAIIYLFDRRGHIMMYGTM